MGLKIIDERVFERMKQLIRMLHERSKNLVPKSAKGEWVDNQDVLLLLDISGRTLQAYRNRGVLPYSQIGHKCYYKLSDVQLLLEKSKIDKSIKDNGRRRCIGKEFS